MTIKTFAIFHRGQFLRTMQGDEQSIRNVLAASFKDYISQRHSIILAELPEF